MILTKRKIRKYISGGELSQYGDIAGKSAPLLQGLVDQVAPEDKYGVKNDAVAVGSGLLTGGAEGASLGSSFGLPGMAAGAVIGSVIGGIKAISGNQEAKRFKSKALMQESLFETGRNNTKLLNYDLTGSNNNQVYAKYGGDIKPLTYFAQGGNLKSLSNDSVEVNGASHENGGVNLGGGIEVEGDETINGLEDNKPFVFSEKLGFAKLHKPIARAIGKMEKKIPNNITTNTIKFLKEKEENLKQEQEDFKNKLGIKNINEFELGGAHRLGGNLQRSTLFDKNIINIDNKLYRLPKRK